MDRLGGDGFVYRSVHEAQNTALPCIPRCGSAAFQSLAAAMYRGNPSQLDSPPPEARTFILRSRCRDIPKSPTLTPVLTQKKSKTKQKTQRYQKACPENRGCSSDLVNPLRTAPTFGEEPYMGLDQEVLCGKSVKSSSCYEHCKNNPIRTSTTLDGNIKTM